MTRRTISLTSVLVLGIAMTVSLAWAAAVAFSHRKHLDMGMDCTTCHANVQESKVSSDNNIPVLEICSQCHDPVPDAELMVPLEREVIFSHEIHVQSALTCTLCHGLGSEDAEARMQLPGMAVCISCHREQEKTEVCRDCHTRLGSPELIPKDHNRQWIFAHGNEAELEEEYCANCHEQSFCQDCHQGDNIRPRPHRRNWVYTHHIEARKGIWECTDCHDAPNEGRCVSCHKSPQGRPSSHRRASWLRRHGDEAEANIAACATCHLDMRSGPLCLLCHE